MKWTEELERLFKRNNHPESSELSTNSGITTSVLTKSEQCDNFNLKVLVITDTHGCLSSDEIPIGSNADVCFLLGDFSYEDLMIIKENVIDMPIYGVLGNHDSFDLYQRAGIDNIHGRVVDVDGVKVAGFQGSLRYKNSNFPFYDDDESVDIADCIDRADILISHDSPKYLHGDEDWAHSGLQGITYYCEKWNVSLNIHGHFHECSEHYMQNGTKSICCYGVQLIDI